MKKLVRVATIGLTLSLLLTMLSACGKKADDYKDKDENKPVQSEQITPDKSSEVTEPEDKDTTTDTDNELGIPSDVMEAVNNVIEATSTSTDIMELVGEIDVDGNKSEIVYYDSDLLLKAMNKNDTFSILTKSDEVKVTNGEKVSKTEWKVELTNEMNDVKTLSFVKVDNNWLLNIIDLVSFAYLEIPSNVEISINGLEVPFDKIENKLESDIYNVPGVLANVSNVITYETGMSESYSNEFIAGAEKPVKLEYELTEADLTNMIPKVEELWKTLKSLAVNNDAAGIQNLLADKSKLDANSIVEALKDPNGDIQLQSFSKRSDDVAKKSDNVCHISAKNTYIFNLLGKFSMTPSYSSSLKTPTEFNWVEVEVQEDGALKLVNASNHVWLSKVNSMSTD